MIDKLLRTIARLVSWSKITRTAFQQVPMMITGKKNACRQIVDISLACLVGNRINWPIINLYEGNAKSAWPDTSSNHIWNITGYLLGTYGIWIGKASEFLVQAIVFSQIIARTPDPSPQQIESYDGWWLATYFGVWNECQITIVELLPIFL